MLCGIAMPMEEQNTLRLLGHRLTNSLERNLRKLCKVQGKEFFYGHI